MLAGGVLLDQSCLAIQASEILGCTRRSFARSRSFASNGDEFHLFQKHFLKEDSLLIGKCTTTLRGEAAAASTASGGNHFCSLFEIAYCIVIFNYDVRLRAGALALSNHNAAGSQRH
jgi:hypothetical protein